MIYLVYYAKISRTTLNEQNIYDFKDRNLCWRKTNIYVEDLKVLVPFQILHCMNNNIFVKMLNVDIIFS